MRKLGSIQKIIDLQPIKGKDRIVTATVLGFEVIVEKDQFKIGDLCVYVEPDSILPQKPEFKFLRDRCFNAKWDGFRIKSMKMAGIFSQGIAFETSIINSKIKEGRDVTKEIGIIKYDPELRREMISTKRSKFVKFMFRFKLFKKFYSLFFVKRKGANYPDDISKSNENNIQNEFAKLKHNHSETLFYKTEKMEGQSASFEFRNTNKQKKWWQFFVKNNFFRVYSHNLERKSPDGSNWWKIAIKDNIEDKLRKVEFDVVVQGELTGPGIQKNIYGFSCLRLFVFRVKNLTTGNYLEFEELKQFCKSYDFEMVPVLDENVKLLESPREMLKNSDGITIFNKVNKKQFREGIIWRSQTDQTISFKVKSPKYCLFWNKEEDKEDTK